jgi:hypothetical protein
VAAAFVYQPAMPEVIARRHQLAVRLDRHPSNLEAAAIMGLAGYRGIVPGPDGGAVVRVERFGRDATALGDVLRAELRRLTRAEILD